MGYKYLDGSANGARALYTVSRSSEYTIVIRLAYDVVVGSSSVSYQGNRAR